MFFFFSCLLSTVYIQCRERELFSAVNFIWNLKQKIKDLNFGTFRRNLCVWEEEEKKKDQLDLRVSLFFYLFFFPSSCFLVLFFPSCIYTPPRERERERGTDEGLCADITHADTNTYEEKHHRLSFFFIFCFFPYSEGKCCVRPREKERWGGGVKSEKKNVVYCYTTDI